MSLGRRVVRRMGSVSSLLHLRRRSVGLLQGSVKSRDSVINVRPLNQHDTVSLDKFKLDQVDGDPFPMFPYVFLCKRMVFSYFKTFIFVLATLNIFVPVIVFVVSCRDCCVDHHHRCHVVVVVVSFLGHSQPCQ